MKYHVRDQVTNLSDALSQELGSKFCSSDDYQIESSTDVDRVKSGATVDDTNCVMVSDEPFIFSSFAQKND